ncbi:LysR substrate-binding domain-containing protein [Paracoccus sp. MBLB3053]|uniref:LysR substrate-binding domain-containing protein n=1 Tax=Paracoccus aurantius TaxID=3073814 RepID=A0ABU2HXQ0_9RHOB|nr:LysR substrate-binding domain-containing protein [Paracoccus sp. MBLB3053]MDS9469828.1 LysR substrate-binding domain-containing protein [Paracoccus sp. MBLB3053]
MDVKQLKYFVAIVDCGGFSQASRQLNIAQPALSQQISRLEYEVGAPLFLRSSRGVTPTPKGLTLHRHAKFILRQIEQALLLTREAETQISGRVTLGLPPTTSAQIGVQLVERLNRRFPGIVLNLVEGLSGNLRALAMAGDLDLTVLFTPSAVPNWDATEFLREELFLVYPVERNLFPASQSAVTIRDLLEVPLILPSPQHGLRRRVDLEFERLNLTCAPMAEIDSLSILMQSLLRGMGATVKPMAAVNVHGPALSSQWRCLPFDKVSMTRINFLYAPRPETISPPVQAVHDELLALIRDEVRKGHWRGVTWIGPEVPE